MKAKNLGKKIAIFYIVLAIIVAILVTTALYQVIINWGNTEENVVWEQANKEENIIKAKDILYENGWGKDIVSEIKENIPIPRGFTYVEGNAENGLIIQEEGTQNKLLWIPLDENADLTVTNEYFNGIEVPEMEADAYESMLKYGGFYVNIGSNESDISLKNITQDQYNKAVKNSQKLYKDKSSINSHVLYKEEIAQIISYEKKLGVDLLKTASNNDKNIEIQKVIEKQPEYEINKLVNKGTDEVNLEKTATKVDSYTETTVVQSTGGTLNQWTSINGNIVTDTTTENNTQTNTIQNNQDQPYYAYQTLKGETVYIPKGFKVLELDNCVKISDETNDALTYIWIPVKDDLDDVRDKIIDKFNELEINDVVDMEFRYSMINEEISPKVKKSIENFKGFYMAEAELSYTNKNKDTFSTKARDMSEELTSAVKDKDGNIVSDYVRKSNIVENGESVDQLLNGAKEIASKVQKQASVESHLAYGAEYDLAALWLIDTGAATAQELMKDSTNLGKYQGTYNKEERSTLLASKYKYLNGLWGFGGNLAELSQETWEFKDGEVSGLILRGGSYATTADILTGGIPAQGVNTIQGTQLEATEESESYYDPNTIGIRNCLIINIEYNGEDEEETKDETSEYIKWDGSIADGFASGDGSIEDQYVIETPSQLAYLAQEVNNGNNFSEQYIQITNSFDMQNINWTPIGGMGRQTEENQPAEEGASFEGFLDGQGHTITNLKIEITDDYSQNIGLIGYLAGEGQVSNINVTNGDITGWNNVGGIVGFMDGVIIDNCTYTGALFGKFSSYYAGGSEENYQDTSGECIGGIVGFQNSGTIRGCTSEGNIKAEKKNVGGIVGAVSDGIIEDCNNKATVEAEYDSNIALAEEAYRKNGGAGINAGGIAGYQESGAIKNCNNEGNIEAGRSNCGGIVGKQVPDSGTVENCENTGSVTAQEYANKIVGNNNSDEEE